jgi:hypothetical protein
VPQIPEVVHLAARTPPSRMHDGHDCKVVFDQLCRRANAEFFLMLAACVPCKFFDDLPVNDFLASLIIMDVFDEAHDYRLTPRLCVAHHNDRNQSCALRKLEVVT